MTPPRDTADTDLLPRTCHMLLPTATGPESTSTLAANAEVCPVASVLKEPVPRRRMGHVPRMEGRDGVRTEGHGGHHESGPAGSTFSGLGWCRLRLASLS